MQARIITAMLIKRPRWFSSRAEKSSREVKLPQKQIHPNVQHLTSINLKLQSEPMIKTTNNLVIFFIQKI